MVVPMVVLPEGVSCWQSSGRADNAAATSFAVVSGARGPVPALSSAIDVLAAQYALRDLGAPSCGLGLSPALLLLVGVAYAHG